MSLGFGNLWVSQPFVNDEYVLSLITIRIFDQLKQSLFSMLYNSPKCSLYKHLADRGFYNIICKNISRSIIAFY